MRAFRSLLPVVVAGLAVLGAGCKRESERGPDAPLRLGFFPNITHAQALVGNEEGTFASQPGVGKLEVMQFNAGPAAMEALVAGSLDVSYVGSGPAINTFLKAGRELRIIAGAVNDGAVLVVRTVKTPAELKGKKLASPQLGNTQDIALRYWLKQQGLTTNLDGTGDVRIFPLSNPDILGQFLRGGIEGAWVPEPWGARLVAEGKGRILVNEKDLWPGGRFPTTVLVTTRKVLQAQRPRVAALLRAHVQLTGRWEQDPAGFTTAANAAFGQITKKPLPPAILQQAFSRLEPSLDPVPQALATAAEHAKTLGFLTDANLDGLVDLRLLDEVRAGAAK